MGVKKTSYSCKKPKEHHSITLNDNVGKSTGKMLSIACDNGKFSIVKVN